MKSIFEHPLLWLHQYQIVQVTSIYQPRREAAKKQQRRTWSWTLQSDYRAELRAAVKSYCDAEIEDAKRSLRMLFERLRHMPLFAGIRDELQDLDRYARDTWNKKHRKTPYVSHVQALPYMTRIKVFDGLTLGAVVAAMQANAEQSRAHADDLARRLLSGEEAPVYLTQSLVSRSAHAPDQEINPDPGALHGADST